MAHYGPQSGVTIPAPPGQGKWIYINYVIWLELETSKLLTLKIILKSCPVDAAASANTRCSPRLGIVRLHLFKILVYKFWFLNKLYLLIVLQFNTNR